VNTEQKEINETFSDYLTKSDFVGAYPHLFSLSELNFIVQHKDENGFSGSVRKISYKKVLLHIPSVLAWIESKK
jgi:hypothetical protein